MDLRISVFLLFVLFTAGHSFSCYQCTDQSSCLPSTCSSAETSCLAITGYFGVLSAKIKSCFVPSLCPSGSANLGTIKASSYCCNTDLCNDKDAPDPGSNSPNGKKCYYCDGQLCNKTLACSGDQDRCVTVTDSTVPVTYKGCVSNSLCTSKIPIYNYANYTCCDGNLCNGGESMTQSFLYLCSILLSVLMMH